jgi:chemotaxis protein histidine kinase CheA
MIDINDPDMKEIVIEFCDESDELLEKLKDTLDEFEDDPARGELLEIFGQTIDRIMGAAKTLGLAEIGDLCQMGKIIGYKGSQTKEQPLQEVTSGVLFDLTDLLEVLLLNVREGKSDHDYNVSAFKDRLQWLASKFKHIERASCSFDEKEAEKKKAPKTTTAELDRLINQFGKAG